MLGRGMKYDFNRRQIIRAQRTVVLRVIRGYRKVSDEVSLFLANLPPGDLLALERARVKNRINDPDRENSTAEIRAA